MNREDIIRMARQAGAHDDGFEFRFKEPRYLERFAALVIANRPPQSSMAWQEGCEAGRLAEREACAKVCEEVERKATHQPPMVGQGCQACAVAIRARGNKPTAVIYSPGQLAERGLTHEDVVKLIKENT